VTEIIINSRGKCTKILAVHKLMNLWAKEKRVENDTCMIQLTSMDVHNFTDLYCGNPSIGPHRTLTLHSPLMIGRV
jgi:hypothetical protein